MSRTHVRGAVTRERLVAAARELFGERGFDGTSIEAVLDRSGVARGALYHHFPSKASLFERGRRGGVRGHRPAHRRGRPRWRRPAGAAARARKHGCRWRSTPRCSASRCWMPLAVLGYSRWRALDDEYTLGALRGALRRLARDGLVPAGQDELLANMLLAALNEAALFIACADDQRAALDTGRATVVESRHRGKGLRSECSIVALG